MRPLTTLLHAFGIRAAEGGRDELTPTGPLAARDFLISNMVCEGCAERIAGALASMPGVRDVTSKVSQKRIRVKYEPGKVGDQQLRDALTAIGFEVLDAGENT